MTHKIKVIICFLFLIHTNAQASDLALIQENSSNDHQGVRARHKKDWTFIVYIAADNDLRSFAARNIKQMAEIGSNNHINIVVQLDIRITGNKKITRRYYVEYDKITHVNSDDIASQKMDSGDPKTLISCCSWAIDNYPADKYALVLWNHGTGIIDPETGRIINPAELFNFNPAINKLELDRSIGFLDFIQDKDEDRGICWDDSTGNYLTNQKIETALKEVVTKKLYGKKLNIIGFDACLMAMLEVANITKNYADYLVASQEVELGPGWDYSKVLLPFRTATFDPASFAKHIVSVYYDTYNKVTNDFTQSAMNLSLINPLEDNTNEIAALLLECLTRQVNGTVKNAIATSRSKLLCTHFDEPSYIDMHHFYTNLQSNLKHFVFINPSEGEVLKKALHDSLEIGRLLIKSVAFANTMGKNLSMAQGISIYFPERRIHSSYRKTNFAATNKWVTFLTQYLLL